MMANWLLVQRTEKDTFWVRNFVTEQDFELQSNVYGFLTSLDGDTDPLVAAEEWGVDAVQCMHFLEEKRLIRKGKKSKLSKSGTSWTVYIPKKKTTKNPFPKIFNLLLLISWCPVLIGGLFYCGLHMERMGGNFGYMLLGLGVSLVVSIPLHEIAHAMACLAYGGRLFEAGILWHFIGPGAYVMVDISPIKSKRRRMQVYAAGVEMHMLLAGISLAMFPLSYKWSGFFLVSAMTNLLFGVANLTFIHGLDGSQILGELIGAKKGLLHEAIIFVYKCVEERRWREMTANRKAVFITFIIVLVYQILFPVMVINNVLSLLSLFW